MATDPLSGVLLLGESLPYLDQAEEALLTTMRGAGDRSTASDELADHIVDWPTRYHLSRLRSNVLRPLRLEPGMRVLDAGAGTGVLSRYLGEQGVEVLALEGNIERARVAQARCEGLAGVTVACGPLQALDDREGFDLVLLNGVLEYSASILGGGGGAAELLQAATRALRPGGALVVAIENQLGLKYLLGYPEDHLGRAFVGLEGYPHPGGVRTWTRRTLSGLLADAGLPAQRWLYPFPDYKLPIVVLDDRLYDRPDVERLVDQIVRDPARDFSAPPVMRADARRIHRTFLEAGLGRDVANSFLVVASADGTAPDRLLGVDALAWRYGDERRRVWLRSTTVVEDGDRLLAHQARLYEDAGLPEAGFVRQQITPERPYRQGFTLEQLFTGAAAAGDHDEMRRILGWWHDHLRAEEVDRKDTGSPHPFLPAEASRILPAAYLDAALDNFVVEDGALHFIDDEWLVPEGVELRLVMARALWLLARSLVTSGTERPWSPTISVDQLAIALGEWCGLTIDRDLLEELRSAEAQFQAVVGTGEEEATLDALTEFGSVNRVQLGLRGHQTEGALGRLERELRDLSEQYNVEVARVGVVEELEAQVASQLVLLEEITEQLAETTAERNQLKVHNAEMVGVIMRIQSRLPMKVYLRGKALVGRLLR
jgi:precorrin-6B methylase 2